MIDECFNAIEPMLGTKAACTAVGRPRATHYRRQAPPRPRSTTPRPAPPNKLTDEEMGEILDLLRSLRFVDLSPAQVFHILLDEGRYLAITALGRQEAWEDSPEGYPQTPPYQWWNYHDGYGAAM